MMTREIGCMTSATMADVLLVAATQQFLKQWCTFSKRRKSNRVLENIVMSRRRRVRESFVVFLREVLRRNLNSERRFWIEPGRTGNYFWERTVSIWSDELWLKNFRMKKSTFRFLYDQLGDSIRRENTRMRDAIPPEKRLAVCLWHLATGEDLRSLSWRFDIGKSTACVIINEVCQAIVCNLLPSYVKWPTGQRLEDSVSSFFTKWNFPQCVGAIDGTHIEIVAPDKNSADYYNRKGRYSVVMQAVVDHAHRFIDVNIKWPGKVHDARVLVNSSLYERAQTGKLFPPDSSKEIEGVEVPLLIIGDAAYPLLPWLMKPFPDGDLTPEQATFNATLRRARMIVEVAFGRLKGRFRCLLKRIDTTLKYLPAKIASCVVLHNLCEMREEAFSEEWLIPEGFDDDSTMPSESRASDMEKDAVRNALVIALGSA